MSEGRQRDFREEDTWRVFRIMAEFVEGFEGLADVVPAVSIFGSGRVRAEPKIDTAGPNLLISSNPSTNSAITLNIRHRSLTGLSSISIMQVKLLLYAL